MTRIEIRIDLLVLRGVPQDFATDLGRLVEQRLTELASAGHPLDESDAAPTRTGIRGGHARNRNGHVDSRESLAALVANRVWSASREGGASG
jgi:hypothetical protein